MQGNGGAARAVPSSVNPCAAAGRGVLPATRQASASSVPDSRARLTRAVAGDGEAGGAFTSRWERFILVASREAGGRRWNFLLAPRCGKNDGRRNLDRSPQA